jgi:hypothetical protein
MKKDIHSLASFSESQHRLHVLIKPIIINFFYVNALLVLYFVMLFKQ